MSKTYRHLDARPAPARVPAVSPPAVVRLLALCRNCGEAFAPTGPHVRYCYPCQLPDERHAYRRTARRQVTA